MVVRRVLPATLLLISILSDGPSLASCAAEVSCVCASVEGQILLRLHVDEIAGERLLGSVEAMLSPDDHGLEIAPGDQLGGTFRVGLPAVGGIPFDCPEGDSRIVELGDAVFAAFSAGSGASRDEALMRGTLWLVPWEQPLRFGGPYEIDTASAGELAERDTCLEHFPTPPPRPCDDVAEVQSFTCSASPRLGARTGDPIANALAMAFAVAFGLLRRGKRPGAHRRPVAERG